MLEQAVGLIERTLGTDHAAIAEPLELLSLLYTEAGRKKEALVAAERVEKIGNRFLETALVIGSDRQKRLLLDSTSTTTDLAVSLAVAAATPREEAALLSAVAGT